jgi:hypothetical protein
MPTMPFSGADLAELSGLVTQLGGPDRADLAAALDRMNTAVQESSPWWVGDYADRFRRDFAAFVSRTNTGLDGVLSQAARVTRQNLGAIAAATGEAGGNGASAGAGGQITLASYVQAEGSAAAASSGDYGTVNSHGLQELGPIADGGWYGFTKLSEPAWNEATTVLWHSQTVLVDHAWAPTGGTRDGMPPHAPDFDAGTQEEYAKMAYQFLQDAGTKGYEVKLAGSTLRIYDPATNTFAAYNTSGGVKTFFKPQDGPAYFNNPSYGPTADPADLEVTATNAVATVDADASWLARMGQFMDSPAGRIGGRAMAVVGVAGDVFTIADPSPNALGGPTTERVMAAANLGAIAVTAAPVAEILAANAALDWVPGVGEVVMAGTVLYFVGDLAWQYRDALAHAATAAVHYVTSEVSHAWDDIF